MRIHLYGLTTRVVVVSSLFWAGRALARVGGEPAVKRFDHDVEPQRNAEIGPWEDQRPHEREDPAFRVFKMPETMFAQPTYLYIYIYNTYVSLFCLLFFCSLSLSLYSLWK